MYLSYVRSIVDTRSVTLGGRLPGQVIAWFAVVKLAGLELPDGWFGRPYGDLYQLTSARLDDTDRLVIELERQLQLSFANPRRVETTPEHLLIGDFETLDFDWREFGNLRPHSTSYTNGAVRFWAQGAQPRD
jgi:hypothetical protein